MRDTQVIPALFFGQVFVKVTDNRVQVRNMLFPPCNIGAVVIRVFLCQSLNLFNQFLAALAQFVRDHAQPGDMVVCLGAGTISAWTNALPEKLKAEGTA